MRDHVLFAAGILDVGLEKFQVEQVGHAQAAAADLIFVSRADAARCRPDLHPSRRILRAELHHAVIGENDLRAV